MRDDLFQALADKHRRFILALLRTRPMTVGDIRTHLPITGATLSHHLDQLKRADLVTVERRGRHLWYTVNDVTLGDVMRSIQEMCAPHASQA